MKYAGVLLAAGAAMVSATELNMATSSCAAESIAMIDFVLADAHKLAEASNIKIAKKAFLKADGSIAAAWSFAEERECTDAAATRISSFLQMTLGTSSDLTVKLNCNTGNVVASFSFEPECPETRKLESECEATDFSEFGLVNGTFYQTQTDNNTIVVACETGFSCDALGECEQTFECHEGAYTPVDVGLVRKNAAGDWVGGCQPLACDVADLDLDRNHYIVEDGTPASVGYGESVLVNCAPGYKDLFWPSYQFQTVLCLDRDSFRHELRAYCIKKTAPTTTSCPLDSGSTRVGQEVTHADSVFRNGEGGTIQCREGFEADGTPTSLTIRCGGPNSASPANPRASLEVSPLYYDLTCDPVICNSDDLDLGETYDWLVPDSLDCSDDCYTVSCYEGAGPNCQLAYGDMIEVSCAAGYVSNDTNVTTGYIACSASDGFIGLDGAASGLFCVVDPALSTVAPVQTTIAAFTTPGVVATTVATVVATTDSESGDSTADPDATDVTGVTNDPDATDVTGVTNDPDATGGGTDVSAVTNDATAVTSDPNATGGVTSDPDATGGVTVDPDATGGVTVDPNATGGVTVDPNATNAPVTGLTGATTPDATGATGATADPNATDSTVTGVTVDPNATEATGVTVDPDATDATAVTSDPNATTTTTLTTLPGDEVSCSTNPADCVILRSLSWTKEQCEEWFAEVGETRSNTFKSGFTDAYNTYHGTSYVVDDLFNANSVVSRCGSVWAVTPVKRGQVASFKQVFQNGALVTIVDGEAQLLFSLGDLEELPTTTAMGVTTDAATTPAATVATTTTTLPGQQQEEFAEVGGVGGLIGIIIAILVVIIIIIVVVVVVTNKKKEEEEEEEEEDPEEEEEAPEDDDSGMLSMHTEASKRLVDGIVEAQMKEQSLEDDSGEHTTSEDTGIDDFNNDSSTGAAQLIATIIHAIDDVDVPSEETTTQEDPVPVTDATNALIGEVLANSDHDSASALTDNGADGDTMDSVDPSTESSMYDGPRDDAYE